MLSFVFIRCAHCGAEVQKPAKEITRKHNAGKFNHFCSYTCYQQYISQRYSMTWQACHYRARYYFFKKLCRPNICERCNKPKPASRLQVHHKDGNYTNNQPENLESLCVDCHPIADRIMRQERSQYVSPNQ